MSLTHQETRLVNSHIKAYRNMIKHLRTQILYLQERKRKEDKNETK